LPEDFGPIIETIEIGAGNERMIDVALGLSTSFPKEFKAMNCLKDEE